MKIIKINDKLGYVPANTDPLSANIGIIEVNGKKWLYDVGNGLENINELKGCYNVVLSHFHLDHIGNLDQIKIDNLYVSKETYRHTHRGIIVDHDLYIDNLHLFLIPSSHAKGCLGLETGDSYAYVGDAIYPKQKGNVLVYNVQLLKEQIEVLKSLKAKYLLISHNDNFIQDKEEVLKELEIIYRSKIKNEAYILVEEGRFSK